jgi:hypothetical protein
MQNQLPKIGFVRGALLILVIFFSSCGNKKEILSPANACSTVGSKYSTDVSVILQTNCSINNAACHGAGSINGPGPLLNYNQAKANANDIEIQVVSRRMPIGGTLSQSDIDKIGCWVDAGAPNN